MVYTECINMPSYVQAAGIGVDLIIIISGQYTVKRAIVRQ